MWSLGWQGANSETEQNIGWFHYFFLIISQNLMKGRIRIKPESNKINKKGIPVCRQADTGIT